MKKNKAIAFIATEDYVFAIATMIINLQKTNNAFYDDIVIIHYGITKEAQEKILEVERRCIFIEYTLDEWIEEHGEITTKSSQHFLKRYSHLAWSKYKILGLLERYKKVLYLDLDMIVRGSIREIFDIDGIAWRNGDNFAKKFGHQKSNFPELAHLTSEHATPNGGLLYVTDDLDYKRLLIQGRDFLAKHFRSFHGAIDELVFAYLVHINKLKLTSLAPYIYNTFPQMLKSYTKIVHFMGAGKTWNNNYFQMIFPEWSDYYSEWLGIGGRESNKVVKHEDPGRLVKDQLNSNRWLDLLNSGSFSLEKYPDLKLRLNFKNEWIIFDYNEFLYFELKFDQYSNGFYIGFWIRNKLISEDKLVASNFALLSQNNGELFKIKNSDQGLYVSTKKMDGALLQEHFGYFYNKVMTALKEVGIING